MSELPSQGADTADGSAQSCAYVTEAVIDRD